MKRLKQLWAWGESSRVRSMLLAAAMSLAWSPLVISVWKLWHLLPDILLGPLIFAPILFILWKFRDENQLQQIENARKDTNLKDFQQLQQWATGQHFKSTSSAPSAEDRTLQVAAVHQLGAFFRGELGEQFRRPAFEILKSLWANEVNIFRSKPKETIAKSAEEMSEDGEDLHKHMHSPLGRALTVAVFGREGEAVRNPEIKNLLPGTCWAGLDVRLPDLGGLLPDLSELNLANTDWTGAVLSGAQLEGAVLRGAQLEGADLSSAYLEGANLSSAYLEGAFLFDAQLEGADLRYANLKGAILLQIDYNAHTQFDGVNIDPSPQVAYWNEERVFDLERSNALRVKLGMQPLTQADPHPECPPWV